MALLDLENRLMESLKADFGIVFGERVYGAQI